MNKEDEIYGRAIAGGKTRMFIIEEITETLEAFGIVNYISANILRQAFNNEICKKGYRFYLKNFGYETWTVNDFINKLLIITDTMSDEELEAFVYS